jgi:hypothetical protein
MEIMQWSVKKIVRTLTFDSANEGIQFIQRSTGDRQVSDKYVDPDHGREPHPQRGS